MKSTSYFPLACGLLLSCHADDPIAASDDTSTSPSSSGADDSGSAGPGSAPGDETSSSGGSVASSGADEGATESSSSGATETPLQVVDDLYRTPMDTMLSIEAPDGLFANDVDADPMSLTLVDADAVSLRGGTIVVEDDGAFSYTPPLGAWGRDRFGYTTRDAAGDSDSAVVTINVLPTQVPLASVTAGQGGYVLDGPVSWLAGYTVAGAGDVDGDGIGDFVSGSPVGTATSAAQVVFGRAEHDTVALGDVDEGGGGFGIRGAHQPTGDDATVDGAGDVNGDGLADVLLSDPWGGTVTTEGEPAPFSVYVIHGKANGDPVDLAAVAGGAGGFVVTGFVQNESYSAALGIAGAGDLNDDGLADIVLAAPYSADTGSPRAWVVFGKADTDAVDVDTLAMTGAGFVLDGALPGPAQCPQCVDGAGDVNGDGADDLVIGAMHDLDTHGRAYVVFGKADTDPVDLAQVALGVGGFAIDGEVPYGFVGRAVAGAGDVDGDGLADLVLSANFYGEDAGRGYVVFGKADTSPIALADVADGNGGFVIDAPDGARLGETVAGGGDIDGDGLDDIAFGSQEVTDANGQGVAYVVYGKADGNAVDLDATDDGSLGFRLLAEPGFYDSSIALDIVDDVDDDALADVLTSGYTASNFAGRVYVFSGIRTAPKPRAE